MSQERSYNHPPPTDGGTRTITSITAPASEPITVGPRGLNRRQLAGLAVVLMASAILRGDVTNVHVGTTGTQAVISYSAPNDQACTLEVREGGQQGPLVPDVDPTLFSATANVDSRGANFTSGRHRIFVVGKRTAETAVDGKRHSRALQTNTAHSFKITCGSSVASGQFTTMNAPVGTSYSDPLPADPLNPGQYAWPDFDWNARNQWVVDPLTGFQIKLFDSPRDAIEYQGSGIFASASNVGTSTDWTNPNAATTDDALSATYSGTTQGFLFLELGVRFINSASHNAQVSSANALIPTFKAYCASADCTTASADDKSIEFCLTIDGLTCASNLLPAQLAACSSNCTSSFDGIVNPKPMLADWYAPTGLSTIEVTDLTKRTGFVTRNGATVTLAFGDRFDLNWKPGTSLTINGTVYAIASVDHDKQLTLAGSPAGSDPNPVLFSVSAAGILIRKKTSSTHQISIQSVSYTYETGQGASLEASGDEDSFANCSSAKVAGPGGELGFHCSISGGFYWVGENTGVVNRLGRAVAFYNPADDGWNRQACFNGSYWDWTEGNTVYCPINTSAGHLVLYMFVYNGDNRDIGDLTNDREPVRCNGFNAPCWTFTNLTPGAPGAISLDLQMAAFNPDWAATNFRTNLIALFGRMASTNSLLFMARRDQNNDTAAFLFRYDLATRAIVSGISTYRHYPLRWGTMHGPINLNDPNWVQVSATNFRGNFTGRDFVAGFGPYYSTITTPGGIDAFNHPCPARPADSTIPVSEWPAGNLCVTISVDGEPGDPTPAYYNGGTITVTGATVTGINTYWNSFMDGTQMTIGNGTVYYRFTWGGPTNPNQGTLDAAPGNVTNSSYKLFLETVNNPKTGNPAFGYLQDTEVRDLFCVTNQVACDLRYTSNEFMRLILKGPGNSWTLQRGWAGSLPQVPLHSTVAGGYMIAFPTSCTFTTTDTCPESRAVWNAPLDPYGLNANLQTVVTDPADTGCCHSTRQNGVNVDSGGICPNRGGAGNIGCYFARFNALPAAFTDPGYPVSNNPPFHQFVGIGSPNAVDSHPGHSQLPGVAPVNELRWIGDARPFLGASILGTGTLLGGSLWRFDSSQVQRLNQRVLPTLASCGGNPLIDKSGPGSLISIGPSDNYKYCVTKFSGECARESSPGDLFVNCPQIRQPFCSFLGIGVSDPDTRDICVGDLGSHALNATQVGVDKPDPDGVNSRRVTAGFGRYKWINEFWNVKMLPNAKFMLVWTTFLQGQRNSLLMVKLPPFPLPDGINRGDYIPYQVKVPTPRIPGATVTNAVVQFGYDANYFCTSRRETCVQGAATEFAYPSDNPAGVACTNGCTVDVPSLSQRVLYYQVLLRDSNNVVVGQMLPEAVAIK